MRWSLDDVVVFHAIVDSGGVTAAARELNMPKSTVSKILTRLETEIGLRLIERHSRRMAITPEGQAFHRQTRPILDQAEEADALMAGLKAAPAGKVVMAVPSAFCREVLAPNLPEFHQRHPAVQLELAVTSQPVDLMSGPFDMAVVVGEQPDSTLTQKVLLSGRLIWIADPDYAARHGLTDADPDFRSHIKICETRYAQAPLSLHINGVARRVDLGRGMILVDDPIAVREAVRCGLGVSFAPARYCTDQLRSGVLVEVWRSAVLDDAASRLAIVYRGGRLLPPRCRAVLDFVERVCRVRNAVLDR